MATETTVPAKPSSGGSTPSQAPHGSSSHSAGHASSIEQARQMFGQTGPVPVEDHALEVFKNHFDKMADNIMKALTSKKSKEKVISGLGKLLELKNELTAAFIAQEEEKREKAAQPAAPKDED